MVMAPQATSGCYVFLSDQLFFLQIVSCDLELRPVRPYLLITSLIASVQGTGQY